MSILRQCPSSPAAPPPLEDDDLLTEILLRLPPEPSSLPRASAVCRRWRSIASDRGFSRRFRRHHPPPLLGFFSQYGDGIAFQPTMEPPNRVPLGRFPDADTRFRPLGCRHGLMLLFDQKLQKVVVWDPVAGDQHILAVPPGFDTVTSSPMNGAVLRTAGDAHHFHVVLAHTVKKQALAYVYSSETGVWSGPISTLVPSSPVDFVYIMVMPAVLAGDSLYWMISATSPAVLHLDLGRQSLAVIHLPEVYFAICEPFDSTLTRTEAGGLGFLFLSGFTAQLWKRNTGCDGVAASWVLGRTVELNKLLSLNSEDDRPCLVLGLAESNSMVFLYTNIGHFTVQLESWQFKKISKPNRGSYYHPFESVYAPGI